MASTDVIPHLVTLWVQALRDAERIELEIDPAYRCHSDEELYRAATIAIYSGRDAHDWVSEMLTEGAHGSSVHLTEQARGLFSS